MANFNGTIANTVTQQGAAVPASGALYVMVFIRSDRSLTGTVRVSPLSTFDRNADGTPVTIDANTDWYPLGSTLAVTGGTNFSQQIAVGGASQVRVDLANNSGGTATVAMWVRPSVTQLAR